MISFSNLMDEQETVPFYKEGFYKYTSERDDTVHQLTRYVVPRHKKGDFLKLIDELTADTTKTLDDICKLFLFFWAGF